MLTQQTLENLRQMRLPGMADAYSAQLQQPDISALSFDERFGLLVDREWTARQDRRLARLLTAAHLKLPACPEDIDFAAPRGLDRALLRELAGARWVREHHNVLISASRACSPLVPSHRVTAPIRACCANWRSSTCWSSTTGDWRHSLRHTVAISSKSSTIAARPTRPWSPARCRSTTGMRSWPIPRSPMPSSTGSFTRPTPSY